VKKTAALAGASAMGLVAAVAGTAGPAMAADVVTTPCATLADQVDITGTAHDNWYGDCIPQFGIGKAEFTIDSDVPYPADFLDLDDPNVATSTNLDGAVLQTYFDTPEPITTSLLELTLNSETASSQNYTGLWVAPITEVGAVDPADLPDDVAAACEVETYTYTKFYYANFGESTTTFSQSIGGEDWSYTVGGTSPTLYVLLPLDDEGIVLPDQPICISNGQFTVLSTPDDSTILAYYALVAVPPYSLAFAEEDPIYDLGIFHRNSGKPALAATGTDVGMPLALAGGLLGIGALAFGFGAARRRAAATR
jgi:hypothetical protein